MSRHIILRLIHSIRYVCVSISLSLVHAQRDIFMHLYAYCLLFYLFIGFMFTDVFLMFGSANANTIRPYTKIACVSGFVEGDMLNRYYLAYLIRFLEFDAYRTAYAHIHMIQAQ